MKKNKVNFTPVGEKVLAELLPHETKVNGIIRVTDLEQNRKGTVVATNNTAPIYIDDVVVFNPSAGVSVSLEEKDYVLLRVDEIYGIDNSK